MEQDRSIVDLLLQQEGDADQGETAAATRALLDALLQLQLAQRRITADLQQQTGLSDSDLTALGLLAHHPPAPVKQIAQALGLTPGSTSTLTDRLTRAGMVDRAPSPDDRRVTLITITTEGTAVLDGVRDRYRVAIDRALQACTAACFDTAAHVLQGVAAGLSHQPEAAGAPASTASAMAQVVHAITADPHGAALASRTDHAAAGPPPHEG